MHLRKKFNSNISFQKYSLPDNPKNILSVFIGLILQEKVVSIETIHYKVCRSECKLSVKTKKIPFTSLVLGWRQKSQSVTSQNLDK